MTKLDQRIFDRLIFIYCCEYPRGGVVSFNGGEEDVDLLFNNMD